MRIFVIPSWYPSPNLPMAGIFVQEQCQALAECQPQLQMAVSTWGHGDLELQLGRPWAALQSIIKYCVKPRAPRWQSGALMSAYSPALTWSHRLPGGGASRLLQANEANFRNALNHWGGIDLIHAHVSYPAGFMAAELSKKYGVPYVVTEHMGPFPFATMMQGNQPMWQIRQALNNAERIIAVSPSLAAGIESFGFKGVQTIPNLVNEDQFCPANLASAKASDSKFVFFTLGNLVPQKGVGDLLKAIALWNPPADEVEFWIGGEGQNAAHYKQQAAELGVADRVKWLGQVPREDAPALFQRCDCFVLPSLHETFGVVLAEAIACGKPVIATRCGGPESIVTQTNGQLVAPGSPAELSQALADMRIQHAQYDPIAIRQSFVSRFSRQAVTQQIVDMYKAVLS